MKVLVTGATGLVGSHAVRHLTEQGYQVRVLVRPSSVYTSAPFSGIEVCLGDLRDSASLEAASRGCHAIVHAAALVEAHGRAEDYFDVNVRGTQRLLEAAERTGVGHFVHISSLSVINGSCDAFAADETVPYRYSSEPYVNSKIEAEKLVLAASEKGKLSTTCLRPGFIYGPEERTWLPRLVSALRQGDCWLIDGGKRETNIIYVKNLCRAISGTLFNKVAYGRVYNLTDGEQITKKQLCDTICDIIGVPRVRRSMPRAAARILTEGVSLLAAVMPQQHRQRLGKLSRGAFRLMGINQGFAIRRAEEELNYTDRISFQQGIAETLSILPAIHYGRSPLAAGRALK